MIQYKGGLEQALKMSIVSLSGFLIFFTNTDVHCQFNAHFQQIISRVYISDFLSIRFSNTVAVSSVFLVEFLLALVYCKETMISIKYSGISANALFQSFHFLIFFLYSRFKVQRLCERCHLVWVLKYSQLPSFLSAVFPSPTYSCIFNS